MSEERIENFCKEYFQNRLRNDLPNILVIPKIIMEKFASLNLLSTQTCLKIENEILCIKCNDKVNSRIPSCNHPICMECYLEY